MKWWWPNRRASCLVEELRYFQQTHEVPLSFGAERTYRKWLVRRSFGYAFARLKARYLGNYLEYTNETAHTIHLPGGATVRARETIGGYVWRGDFYQTASKFKLEE